MKWDMLHHPHWFICWRRWICYLFDERICDHSREVRQYAAREAMQALLRRIAAAYERRSVAIASHWPFDQWGHFLPEQTTAAALLDRLLHHAAVVVTEGESFRLLEARTRGGEA